MTLSIDEIHDLDDQYAGYCPDCDDLLEDGGFEPDARDRECPECGGNRACGVEEAVLVGLIQVGE